MTTTPITVPEIRDLLCTEPSRVSDPLLLALLLGKGSRRKIRGQPAMSWTCVELGEALYEQAGGRLRGLVTALRRDAIDFRSFGIGEKLAVRLVAAAELAYRWRRGLRRGGDAETGSEASVRKLILERQKGVSEGDLLALLFERYRHGEETMRLCEHFGSPQALMESLEFDSFRPTKVGSPSRMTLAGTDLTLLIGQLGQLLSGLELARRYRVRAAVTRRKLSPGASGLSSVDLVTLLDTGRRLDRPLRETLVRVLRTHPEVAKDFEDLDRLAADAGVESHDEAVEVHQMFEELAEREGWTDPAEVVGPGAPFAGLLSVVRAKIARTGEPSGRLREIQELLLRAQREAIERPVASFVEALLELGINEEGAEEAFEEARRRYFERPAPAHASQR